ncbi:unnamed protein product [Cladocopium goreaui]|uniref:Fe2OG dioxygenase domain-containing protein n=1 Tax=Cladocopium goreaui TaxID=2562237 RepID=A0A9P1FQ85_9DINO|nr:unnamed protein product [Cladocopium goreaui]
MTCATLWLRNAWLFLASSLLACADESCATTNRGAAARAWEKIEAECREKLEQNRTAAAMRCLEGHFWEAREPGKRAGDFFTTLRKLRHDAEMFTWLEQEGKVTTELKKVFRGIFHSAKQKHSDPDKVFELAFNEETNERKMWQKANNKAVYWDPAGREVPSKTLRAKAAALKGLEDSLESTGRAVCDRFLSSRALRHLKRFLEASTFYFYPRSGYHLLALLEDGLASPLLAQLVDGIRHALPRSAGTQPLRSVRAWKADNSALQRPEMEKPELGPQGKLNLLLWLVPTSALNGSAAGALQLLPRNATGRDAPVARVAYAANRAVLWQDELKAEWVGPGWKSGFLQRGIHLLFTFGWSEDGAAGHSSIFSWGPLCAMSSPASDRPGRPPAERSDRTAQSFDERYRSASFIEEDPRRAISGLVLPSNAVGVASLQVGKAGKVTPSKASPLLPKRLQNVSDASDMNEDSASSKTPSTKRVMDIPELVRQFEDLLHDFRQDAEEHMFNVIGPNPWNLGFIQTGPLQKRAINLLKAFTRSVQLQFPKAYSLDEAMKPPTVRRFMRTCKLCLEDVGQWTQICLIHVSAFCKHEKLEQDIQHILSQGGNINARAMFEVCLQYQNRDETTSVSCSVQPIHLAVHAGNLRGVEVLLRQKAAVESRSTFDAVPDFTPLHLATALWARAGEDSLKQHEVVKLLLAQLADPNAVDLSGTTCNRLRPAASASRPQGQSGLRKGMYVTLNTEKANQIPRLRRDAKEFLQTADFSRQSEFIVVADVEDPENEHELVPRPGTATTRDLKIQQSCVDVLGWRFFSDCCLALKDELPGSGVGGVGPGGSAELSPKFNKSHTATTWQEEDLRRNRAVTIHEAEAGDAPVLSEDEGEESFPHDVPWEDAIHMKLANPLRDGRFFRKRNRVVSGYLLHFAVDELVFSESELDRDVVRSIVQLRADVHSRAWVKRNISKDFFDVTAIHMAAASFSLPAVKTLLEIKASIEAWINRWREGSHGTKESAATFDEIPCWTPLADALLATIHHSKDEDVQKASKQPKSVLQIKTKECVIQSLLKERANPDGCGGSGGLSCLHLADVTLKTSGYVRATRAHGNRGWDRGLTPLQICDYADQVYPQQARSEVMALLAPSLRGASFLLQDVTSMSAFSLSAADELVRRVVEEAEAKKEGSAARALNTLRLRAITGSKSPEGFTPLAAWLMQWGPSGWEDLPLAMAAIAKDGIAELIEIAPTTAIKMLDGLLLTEPAAWMEAEMLGLLGDVEVDTEDPHVHPLPHRANMNYKHRAQGIGWSATIFDLPNLSVQTTYQPDCNIDRNSHFDTDKDDVIHQEWPCWLRQQKTWHGVLAPKASCTRASLVGPAGFEKSFADQMGSSSAATRLKYQQGDRDVCIKVLLVANILDVRILQALTNVGWSEIFAEKVVQAILSVGYENFCFRPITASLIQETVLFAAFLWLGLARWGGRSWSFGCFSWQPKKTPWAVIFAIFVNESITMAWWMRGHFSHNWTLKQFFLHPMTSFRLFQLYLLWWLLWRTFFGYDLDHTWRNDEDLGDNKRTFERLCDRVCEAVLEALLSQDVESRAQLDACAKLGMVRKGRVATVPYESIMREAVRAAGYDHEDMGMDWRTVNIIVALEDRSAEWHRALLGGADPSRSLGDDQAVLCGYATDETLQLQPLSQQLAEQLAARMDAKLGSVKAIGRLRLDGSLPWLRPDARAQVTVKYVAVPNSPGVSSIAIVYGHAADVKPSEAEQDLLEKVVKVVLPSLPESVAFTPRSAWRAGASASGASGRRHLESYGGWAPGRERDEIAKKHRGPWLRLQRPRRRQPFALWWAGGRMGSEEPGGGEVLQKMWRDSGRRVQLRYVAGEAQIQVDSYGSARSDAELEELSPDTAEVLLRHFDFRPQALQKELQLNASMKAKEKPWEKPKAWSWRKNQGRFQSLLGANLLLQCFLFIFLAKGASPRLEFGRHLLAILHSFLRLGVIFTVLFLVFASFTSAYLVMGSRLPLRALIEKVQSLSIGEGLDVMEGGSRHGELQPNNLDTYLTLLSTFIVTICLLNVSIAVFTMEYEAAIKESWLHFWRWRARLCTEVLLCPRWPWKFESKKSQCVERRYMAQYLEMAVRRLKDEVLPTVYNSRICQRTFNLFGYRISWERLEALDAPEDEARDEDAEYVRLVGWMTVATVTLLGVVLLFLPFVHGIFSGICLGIGFTILKSLCARGPYGNSVGSASEHDSDDEDERPRGAERPHFLWICYRADYDANVFMNKEVHKEHLDQLENRVNHMSQNLETFGHQVIVLTAVAMAIANLITVFSVEYLVTLKFYIVQLAVDTRGVVNGIFVLMALMAFWATLGASLVQLLAPDAGGSGSAENKGWLNGFDTARFFSVRTLVVRFVAVIIFNTTGYPCGREGPTVTQGSGLAFLFCRCISSKHKGAKEYLDMRSGAPGAVRMGCIVGGACGMAMIFDSPLGGILYMFEEVGPALWPVELTFKAFVGCVICTSISYALLAMAHTSIRQFVIFEMWYGPSVKDYSYRDVPGFLVLSLFCGLLAPLHTMLCLRVAALRKRCHGESWPWKVAWERSNMVF